MKVLLLTTDTPAQRSLARRIDDQPELQLVGIAVQRLDGDRGARWLRRQLARRPGLVLDRLLQRTVFARTVASLARHEATVFQDSGWPQTTMCATDDVNGSSVLALIASTQPDVVAVSGTRMVRSPVFATAPPKGLYNLHTGLSPYYNGGPNCTLWCLANGDPAHIGVTIHVLDAGIDSGPLLRTVRTPIGRDDGLADVVIRTMQVGHEAYVDVLCCLAAGRLPRSVDQSSLGTGRTYLTREWNSWQMTRAVWFVRTGGLRRWVDSGSGPSPRLVDAVSESELS